MATYTVTLMHGERGGEGQYSFEAEDGLIRKSAFTTLRRFMEHLETKFDHSHFDWHANAVLANADKTVVTAMGSFLFHEDDEQPFVCMISQA